MKTTSLALAVGVAGAVLASTAQASHFRGGAIVPSVDANGLVTLTATTFWRKTFVSGVVYPAPGEGSWTLNGGSIGHPTQISQSTDQADSRFAIQREVATYQLSGAGTYTFKWSSCCRVAGIANAAESFEDLEATIVWDGKTANTPILFDFSAINPEVVRGTAYNDSLGATSGSGLTLSYDQALNLNINSQPATSFNVDPATGTLSISASDTALMTYDNGSNAGADYAFSGNIMASDGSRVEFDWLFDAVNTGSQNLAPDVNDLVINALVGDTITDTVTGSDPDGDPLTWSLLSIFGPGDTTAFSFDPATQGISWNTTGVAAGTYIANIRASDGSLTDVGTVTINLRTGGPTTQVPEPAGLALLGLGLTAFGLRRRRKG